ncbi:restriction endonuclease subunit S [Mycoplasma procyoni]|uniref:restriction endonuclease subunit S n=1 Tax=Mycoplasma procyoni TaxID=568784 RepID=UPI00197BD86F|nr:restriction endonuclease subunit S [Mycoplasma procyoni]MBN3534509.1 restriction endonuclease subunit S [Mycoplasma procyoni]
MKLKEIIKIYYGKNQKDVEDEKGDIPIYGSSGRIGYSTDFLYDGESVLIARKGTLNKPLYVNNKFWTIDTMFYTKVISDKVITKFLFYAIQNINLNGFSQGTAVPSLTTSILYNIEISVPDLQTQQHIVNTISSVDDLIEKYERIIGKIKDFRSLNFKNKNYIATNVLNFVDLVSFENGWQPPKNFHIYEEKENYVRFIQNRDYSNDNHLTFIPVSKKNHICNKDDIMIDKYGEAGKVRYGLYGAYNVALLKIIPLSNDFKEYLRDFLSQSEIQEHLYQSSQASTRPSLNEGIFSSLKIATLSNDEMKEYQKSIEYFLKLELSLKDKKENLQKIKNQLLNKYF